MTGGLALIDQAVQEHAPVAVFALFSGGHDSLTAAAITARHHAFSAAVFIDTGTGIPRTTEFVRRTCAERGWRLIELSPDGKRYEDLIREQGFGSGPKSHSTAYYWLKQRQIRRLVREHKASPRDRIVLTTGVRVEESTRRMTAALAVPVRRDGAQVWVNPILDWTAVDCSRFIDAEGLTRNEVVDTLHRSGECLCATLFARGDRAEVLTWAPEMVSRVEVWEAIAREAGHTNCSWGVALPPVSRDQLALDLPLCSSCVQAIE